MLESRCSFREHDNWRRESDKEALTIIFGVQKFHKYLYGTTFCLQTDHKLLTYIFNKQKHCPQLVANRLQRYAFILPDYDFQIEYIPSK